MTQKTLYLHIGFHKTASSTIQVGLANNRPLLERHGYCYPKSCIVYQVAHHNAVWHLRNDHRFIPGAGRLQDLIREIEQAEEPSVIISSEDFSFCDIAEVQVLRNHLSNIDEVYIIAYLRRQDKWLASRWAQVVKHGYSQDDFQSSLENGIPEADFYRKLNPWIEVFGKDNIKPRVLERRQMVGDVLQDFLLTCGLQEVDGFSAPPDQNLSPSLKTLEVIRYFTGELRRNNLKGEMVSRVAWQIRQYADEHGWNTEPPSLVTREIYERIMAHLADSNSRLARDFLDQEKLFLESFEENPMTGYSLTDLESLELLNLFAAVIHGVIEAVRKEERLRANYVLNNHLQVQKNAAVTTVVRKALDTRFAVLREAGRDKSVSRILRKLIDRLPGS